MTIRFHPPENQSAYAEHVLAILTVAAVPLVMEQLEQVQQQDHQEPETISA